MSSHPDSLDTCRPWVNLLDDYCLLASFPMSSSNTRIRHGVAGTPGFLSEAPPVSPVYVLLWSATYSILPASCCPSRTLAHSQICLSTTEWASWVGDERRDGQFQKRTLLHGPCCLSSLLTQKQFRAFFMIHFGCPTKCSSFRLTAFYLWRAVRW